MRVMFPCGPLVLEGEVHASSSRRAAVICHPHPQYGGDMQNSVVRAIATACETAGMTTLRFNFRGTGRSTGAYANGVGERDDVRAAVAYVRMQADATSVIVAGYSFGAMVAIQTTPDLAVEGLLAVAPPLSFFDLHALEACTIRKLFIVGDHDQYCSAAGMRAQLERVPEPTSVQIIPGADHFFLGYDAQLHAAVSEWVR